MSTAHRMGADLKCPLCCILDAETKMKTSAYHGAVHAIICCLSHGAEAVVSDLCPNCRKQFDAQCELTLEGWSLMRKVTPS